MDIDELKALKTKLENDIFKAVSLLYDSFAEKTRIYPLEVNLPIVDTAALGEIDRDHVKYCIRYCAVNLGIEI